MPDPDATATTAVDRGMRAMLTRRADDLAGGATGIGWKIGFDTPAIQKHFGLSEAVVGYLTDSRVEDPGATVSLAGWVAPAVEVELAVRVGDDGDIAGLGPALELVDLDISFEDIEPVLAGNICHRGVVFGPEVPGADPMAMAATVTRTARSSPRARSRRIPPSPSPSCVRSSPRRRRARTGAAHHLRLRRATGRRRARGRARRVVRSLRPLVAGVAFSDSPTAVRSAGGPTPSTTLNSS